MIPFVCKKDHSNSSPDRLEVVQARNTWQTLVNVQRRNELSSKDKTEGRETLTNINAKNCGLSQKRKESTSSQRTCLTGRLQI